VHWAKVSPNYNGPLLIPFPTQKKKKKKRILTLIVE
jgi:hypothetical protein